MRQILLLLLFIPGSLLYTFLLAKKNGIDEVTIGRHNMRAIIRIVDFPRGVSAIDTWNKNIYFASGQDIFVATYNTSNQVYSEPVHLVQWNETVLDVAIHAVRGDIYWCGNDTGKIFTADHKGLNIKRLTHDYVDVSSIVISEIENWLIYTQGDREVMMYNITSKEVLPVLSVRGASVIPGTVMILGHTIFFVQSFGEKWLLMSTIISKEIPNYLALEQYEELFNVRSCSYKLFKSVCVSHINNMYTLTIKRLDEPITFRTRQEIRDISFVYPFASEDLEHCLKSNCSHDCVEGWRGEVCVCPPGWRLGPDTRTCSAEVTTESPAPTSSSFDPDLTEKESIPTKLLFVSLICNCIMVIIVCNVLWFCFRHFRAHG